MFENIISQTRDINKLFYPKTNEKNSNLKNP